MTMQQCHYKLHFIKRSNMGALRRMGGKKQPMIIFSQIFTSLGSSVFSSIIFSNINKPTIVIPQVITSPLHSLFYVNSSNQCLISQLLRLLLQCQGPRPQLLGHLVTSPTSLSLYSNLSTN